MAFNVCNGSRKVGPVSELETVDVGSLCVFNNLSYGGSANMSARGVWRSPLISSLFTSHKYMISVFTQITNRFIECKQLELVIFLNWSIYCCFFRNCVNTLCWCVVLNLLFLLTNYTKTINILSSSLRLPVYW